MNSETSSGFCVRFSTPKVEVIPLKCSGVCQTKKTKTLYFNQNLDKKEKFATPLLTVLFAILSGSP